MRQAIRLHGGLVDPGSRLDYGGPGRAWNWQAFEMRLDDPVQKQTFLEGNVPAGARILQ